MRAARAATPLPHLHAGHCSVHPAAIVEHHAVPCCARDGVVVLKQREVLAGRHQLGGKAAREREKRDGVA